MGRRASRGDATPIPTLGSVWSEGEPVACTNCGGGSTLSTSIVAGTGVVVTGSGTVANPYVIGSVVGETPTFQVRDSSTVNLTLFGSGTEDDPYTLSGDTSGASRLAALADVQGASPDGGDSPVWVGSSVSGHFEFQPNGVWYVTSTTRPAAPYQGLQIKETDTGKRYEFDGSTWVDVTPSATPTTFAAANLTGTVLDANLQGRLQGTALLVTGDANSLNSDGWYRGNGLTNAPTGGEFYFYHVQSHAAGSGTANVSQTAYRYQGTDMYQRVRLNSGAWSAWDRIVTLAGVNAGYLDSRFPVLSGGRVANSQSRVIGTGGRMAFPASGWVSDHNENGIGFGQTVTINLPNGLFSAQPQVMVTANSAASQGQHVGTAAVSTTSFQTYWWRASQPTTTISADWAALQFF